MPAVLSLELWRAALSSAFGRLDAVALADGPFDGGLVSRDVGQFQLSQVRGGAVRVVRTPRAIRRDPQPFYKLSNLLQGTGVLQQDGREAALAPGDLAIYDTTRPYSLTFEQDFRTLVVMFPHALLGISPVAVAASRRGGSPVATAPPRWFRPF